MLQTIGLILGALFFIGLAIKCLPYAIAATIACVVVWLSYAYWKIAVPIWIGFIAFGCYLYNEDKKKVSAWKEKQSERKKLEEIDEFISTAVIDSIVDENKLDEYKFLFCDDNGLPYGRVNAFLNFFNFSINDTEPYYFSAVQSKDNKELREYGTLICRSGIYISHQLEKKDADGVYCAENIFIPFAGMTKVEKDKNKVKVSLITDESLVTVNKNILAAQTTLNLVSIQRLLSVIIGSEFPKILYDRNFINFEDACDTDLDKEFNVSQRIYDTDKLAETAGIAGSNVKFGENYAETKNFMNGARGHGYAGEYVNNTYDRLMGKDVTNAGQQLDEHGRQVKHGADRIVNGEHIQTKYYQSAEESIGAAFQHKQALYINPDGSMMTIEVPRDQYSQALVAMQKRIDSGQVPNAAPGTPAQKFVKRGIFTYNQTCNVCKAGTLESLSVDLVSGVISSTISGSISGLMVFAVCIWNGKSAKEAAQISLTTTLSTMGKSVLVYTLTMQLSREQFANFFVQKFTSNGVAAGFEGIANPVAKLSNNLAQKVSQSALAKTSAGEFLGLGTVTGRAIISGTIIGLVVFGPDLVKAMRGRISKMQLLKNSSVGAGSLAGAAVGQAMIPVPVLGAMVGAVVSGFVVKKTLDGFIDDDAIQMFQIFKEEFLECTMLMSLSKNEFDKVIGKTVCCDQLQAILQDMYQSGQPREFAHELIEATVCETLKERKIISCGMIDEGYFSYCDEAFQAA